MSNNASEVRKLMMLISDLRSKDSERYEQHVAFMNEVVTFIKKISDNMNESWKKINGSLQRLNKTIEESLDTLLTGINPEGIKETSKGLKDIMDTMSKSMQSMNLENLMRQLQVLTGQAPAPVTTSSQAQPISTQFGSPYSGSQSSQSGASGVSDDGEEIYGYVPDNMKKKKKKGDDEEHHLMRPSDLFKS
ncbi:MAG: hypothetical protein GF364_19120 [Candidatus Lokiarchaeota archaeon]|nr:hypothetical protein [Candidatus Lokiarchaeota archaeon]